MTVLADKPFIVPDWPAPASVRAYVTTRKNPSPVGGTEPFNLALHGSDNPESVLENRVALRQVLELPAEPAWLEQVHGLDVWELYNTPSNTPIADASITRMPGLVCVVLTADCLPVLLCDENGTAVAAVHAGWRGLQQNIIAATVRSMNIDPASILAWLGPAISSAAYEVDEQVRRQFPDRQLESAFKPSRPGHYKLDMYEIARQQLMSAGIEQIYGGEHCTFTQRDLFFSYRRESHTGRMASLIWISD